MSNATENALRMALRDLYNILRTKQCQHCFCVDADKSTRYVSFITRAKLALSMPETPDEEQKICYYFNQNKTDSRQLYVAMTTAINARDNCEKNGNFDWYHAWDDFLEHILGHLPHGSGLDYDWEYDWDTINSERLVLKTSFHSMDEMGGYDAVIDFKVIVKAHLQFGYDLLIVGNFGKRQDIKEYLYDILNCDFNQYITDQPEPPEPEK